MDRRRRRSTLGFGDVLRPPRHRVSRERRNLGSFQEWRRRSEIKKLIGAFGNVLNWREQILLGKISAKMPDTRARGTVRSVDSFSYSSPFLLRHCFFFFLFAFALRVQGAEEIEGDPTGGSFEFTFLPNRFSIACILACTYVMISFLCVCVCMCVLFRDRVEVSRDFIVGRCVIVCSMLEDKRYFLFFSISLRIKVVVVILDFTNDL